MFLREEKFTPGILFDVVMLNVWMRTERKEQTMYSNNRWKLISIFSMDDKLALGHATTPLDLF
jgi:hypothetical protein